MSKKTRRSFTADQKAAASGRFWDGCRITPCSRRFYCACLAYALHIDIGGLPWPRALEAARGQPLLAVAAIGPSAPMLPIGAKSKRLAQNVDWLFSRQDVRDKDVSDTVSR